MSASSDGPPNGFRYYSAISKLGPCAGRDPFFDREMPFVYVMASQPYGTLYIGSTFDLARRVLEHKSRAVPGFTAKYGVDTLVWFEVHETLETALIRERQIKKWKRDWKINLIERDNPHWIDLYPSLSPNERPNGSSSL